MVEEVVDWRRRRTGDPCMILAHRGGTGSWRENTTEAFSKALSLGADGVELDVRRTADGRIVVHHDPEIAGVGLIHTLSARELPEWVPGLDQALEACAGAVVNVEVKNSPLEPGFDPEETVASEVAAAVEATSPRADGGPRRVIVSSFWPASLVAVRRRCASVATGLLVHPSLEAAAAADQALQMGCVSLHLFHSQVTPALVTTVHGRGLAAAAWTVNEAADLAAMDGAAVDIVITDRVAGARAALGR
jgi:glycerophosphoryl diester phosphodiesterase